MLLSVRISIINILQPIFTASEPDFLCVFNRVQTVSRFYSFDERLTVLGRINQMNAGLIERDGVERRQNPDVVHIGLGRI